MSARLDTKGIQPVVEYRSALGRYFITYPELGVELAPAFNHKWTAFEIAVNAFHGTPFFTMIPTVAYGTEYPRPGLVMPRLRPMDVPLSIR